MATSQEKKQIAERLIRLQDPNVSPIDGWMDIDELEWLYNTAIRMDTIVEIGAWAGRSTAALLRGCPGVVFSVDPWQNGELGEIGYQEYIYNTKTFTNLVIMKMYSHGAAYLINTPVDMVFIDGDHKYESVIDDIESWLPKTKKIICGHDYGLPDSPGVKKAVDEKFNDVRWVNSIWYKEL